MAEWKVSGIYTINNFSSGYLSPAVKEGNVFCAGEVDVALALSANDSINEIYVAEIDPKTAALGEWKKAALEKIKPDEFMLTLAQISKPNLVDVRDYMRKWGLEDASKELEEMLEGGHTFEHMFKVYDRLEEKAEKRYNNVKKSLESEVNEKLGEGLPVPIGDCGSICNLRFIIENYSRIKQNMDKVNIISNDALKALDKFGDNYFDYISLNNILDYHNWEKEGDVKEVFELVNRKLNQGGKVIVTTTEYNDNKYIEMRCDNEKETSAIDCIKNNGRVLRPFKDLSNMTLRMMGGTKPMIIRPDGEEIYLDEVLERLNFKIAHVKILSDTFLNNKEETETPSAIEMNYCVRARSGGSWAVIEAYEKL